MQNSHCFVGLVVLIILVVFIIAAKIVFLPLFATTLVARLYTLGGVASRQVDMYEPEEDFWTDGSYPSLR